MGIRVVELGNTLSDEIRWNTLLSKSEGYNYTSNFNYSHTCQPVGRTVESFIFLREGEEFSGAHYSYKKSVAGLISVSDIKSGIIFKSQPEPETYSEIIEHYLSWAKDRNVSFARINSWIPIKIDNNSISYSEKIDSLFIKYGFFKTAVAKHTYWIDITQPEHQLLKNMKRQTRYDARQGDKHGLIFEQYNTPDEFVLNQFVMLYSNLGNKKEFDIIDGERFKKEIAFLLSAKLATIFVAKYEGTIVNISIAANYGQSQYLYGAINPEFKKLNGCPSPGPVAQWEMIKEMKRKGFTIYDMGFCPGPIPYSEHPKYSIWRFKYGFGGKPVEYLPVYGKVIQPLRGRLFYFSTRLK